MKEIPTTLTLLLCYDSFLIDDIPIREYMNTNSQYPAKPMFVYATIWDASSWATDGGQYKVNYEFSPFKAVYTNFAMSGCSVVQALIREHVCYSQTSTNIFVDNHPILARLSNHQFLALEWVRMNYMIYDYCKDIKRYPIGLLPEC